MIKYLWVFLISMLPVIELRGAVPYGVVSGLDPLLTLLVAIAGNILPVPFLVLFSKKAVVWLSGWKVVGPFFKRLMSRAENRAAGIGKYELLGLMIFVGIPLPGTGAWTGSLVAALLQLRLRSSFVSIALGVVIAGIIMSLASAGLLGVFNSIFSFH